MWKARTDIKKTARRFYEIEEMLIEPMVHRGYEVNENLIIEIPFKEEPQLKTDLTSATMETLAEEAKEYFTKIALASYETEASQNSEEWAFDRLGVINASLSIFKSTGKPIDDLDSYVAKKVTEGVYLKADESVRFELSYSDGIGVESKSTRGMERGHELEPHSIEKWLDNNSDYIQIESNMIKSDVGLIGASIDLLALNIIDGTHKIVEIKNPKHSTYLRHGKTKYLSTRYKSQIQIQMLISGVHDAELVVDYPEYRQVVTKMELDIEFVVNAMQTHKRYMSLFDEYMQLDEELRL